MEAVVKFPTLSMAALADICSRIALGDVLTVAGTLFRNAKGCLEIHVGSVHVLVPWKHTSTTAFVPEPISVEPAKTSLQACKYWLNTGRCHRVNCGYSHTPLAQGEREAWVQQRVQNRHVRAAIDGDHHDPHAKMSHQCRAAIFCQWLIDTFTRERLAAGASTVL